MLFLAPRIVLLFAREPFFDELYTRWIAQKSFAGILEALRSDSGPPLYYFAVHFLPASVRAIRLFSLVCAAVSVLAILRAKHLGVARYLAAALLAAYPPAVLFATDARAYAMCATFITLGVLARRTWPRAACFVAAAYTHYYGALFIPLLLLVPLPPQRERVAEGRVRAPRGDTPMHVLGALIRRFAGEGLMAFLAAAIAFAPAAYLALTQPPEARRWVDGTPLAPLTHLSFAADYPEALFRSAPLALTVIALAALVVAVARGRNAFALMTLIPLAIVTILGRAAYVPMRFEAVLAAPLVLWLATSLHAAPRRLRIGVAALLIAIGAIVVEQGIVDHLRRPVDPYRFAANVAATTPSDVPVVASGYLYLETVTLRPSTIAFPREQASHPGWRRASTVAEARAQTAALPAAPFTFVCEREAPELTAIRQTRPFAHLYSNDFAVVARIGRRP